jgi:hypothetical protein
MACESNPENLLVDLNHLAGCGEGVAKRTLTALLRALAQGAEPGLAQALGGYPMTAWLALAPAGGLPQRAWAALRGAGLSEEQGMTVLAVIDDHARRRFGNRAWAQPGRIAATLASEHGLRIPGLPPASTDAVGPEQLSDAGGRIGR